MSEVYIVMLVSGEVLRAYRKMAYAIQRMNKYNIDQPIDYAYICIAYLR